MPVIAAHQIDVELPAARPGREEEGLDVVKATALQVHREPPLLEFSLESPIRRSDQGAQLVEVGFGRPPKTPDQHKESLHEVLETPRFPPHVIEAHSVR